MKKPKQSLSRSDKNAANFLAKSVKKYGPLDQRQVSHMAKQLRNSKNSDDRTTAYGLECIAAEMEYGYKVTGAVSWWKRI